MNTIQRVFKYLSITTVNGILFIIPIGIVFIILQRVFRLIEPPFTALHLNFTRSTVWQSFFTNLIIIFLIVLLCFLAGLFPTHCWGGKFIAWLENTGLSHRPGYYYLKGAASDVFGVEDEGFEEVVLVRQGIHCQIDFKMESITVNDVVVFISSVPRPRARIIYIVDKENIFATDLTRPEAVSVIKSMGLGASKLLEKYFTDSYSNGKESKMTS